ncbi:MAG: sigma-70 family RNA polymerase sigma factor [Planctomycetota bacterium]
MSDSHSIGIERLLEHSDWLTRFARAIVGEEHGAEDVVQETWLAALRSPPRAGSARGWLSAVARNALRKLRRGERARGRRELAAARAEGQPDTAEIAARVELQRTVARVVLAQDEPYRTALLLRFVEGMEPAEIARRMGVPGSTIRTRVRRGLDLVRRDLDGDHGGDRRAWAVPLLALLAPRKGLAAGGAAAAATGAVLMGAKTKAAVLATLVVLIGVAGWVTLGPPAEEPPGPAERPSRAELPGADRREEPVPGSPEDTGGGETAPEPARTGPKVRGRVLTPHGDPIEGATVVVNRRKLRTDETGAFEIPAGTAGEVTLRVEHRSFLVAEETVTLPARGLEIGLDPGLSVAGRVTDLEGTPLPGVWMAAGRDYRQTDDEGRYRLSGLEPGTVWVECFISMGWAPTEERAPSGSCSVRKAQAGDADVDFSLWKTIVKVRVLDEDRRPARDATVTVDEGSAGPSGTVNGNGEILLTCRRRTRLRFTVMAPGRKAVQDELQLADEQAVVVREVVLPPPERKGTLEIVVRDPVHGVPEKVYVSLRVEGGPYVAGWSNRQIQLDAKGRARVPGVTPGRYRVFLSRIGVFASPKGYALTEEREVVIEPGRASSVDASVKYGGRIRVSAGRDARGRPTRPDGDLRLRDADGEHCWAPFGMVTQVGYYSPTGFRSPTRSVTPIPPGTYTLELWRDGEVAETRTVVVEAERTVEVEFEGR